MALRPERGNLTARFSWGPEKNIKWRKRFFKLNATHLFMNNSSFYRKMAFLKSLKGSISKTGDGMKLCSAFIRNKSNFTKDTVDVGETGKETNLSDNLLTEIQRSRKESEMPVKMENPFTPEKPKCLLCKYDIEPNFKNVRLLSQFVSTYTGRVYGRYITGLCENKQKKVELEIKKAYAAALMSTYTKDPNFFNDPDLYDPAKPFKVL